MKRFFFATQPNEADSDFPQIKSKGDATIKKLSDYVKLWLKPKVLSTCLFDYRITAGRAHDDRSWFVGL